MGPNAEMVDEMMAARSMPAAEAGTAKVGAGAELGAGAALVTEEAELEDEEAGPGSGEEDPFFSGV